jgi:alkaline phosphatase D
VRAAAQARQEWVPRRLMDPTNPLLTWQSVAVGDLAELVLLDTRYVGRDRQAGDDGALPLDDPRRSLLGEQQRAWAEARLRGAQQPWAIVVSGVVVNELELPWPKALCHLNALLPNGYAVIDGRVLHDDQWDGYPTERDRLAGWCRDRAASGRRTVLLSGDVHSSWAFVGPDDPVNPSPVAIEFTVPAVSSAAMGRAHFPGMSVLLDRAVARMDHVSWAEVTRRGYCILELTPEQAQAEWWFVQPYDQDPAASAVLGAAFVTERDTWPPVLVETKTASNDPTRRGLPTTLPARPSDLGALRQQHKARILRRTLAVLLPLVAAAVLWATRARRPCRA